MVFHFTLHILKAEVFELNGGRELQRELLKCGAL